MKLVKKIKLNKSYKRYDIEVENTHNFIANGLVVHNSNIRLGLIHGSNETGDCSQIWMAGSHNTNKKEFDNLGRKVLYWLPYEWYPQVKEMMMGISLLQPMNSKPNVVVYGEIFGSGVANGWKQMTYGYINGQKDFRVFDISIDGIYMDWPSVVDWCKDFNVPIVPELYRGPYSDAVVKLYTDGQTCFKEGLSQIREGIVLKPLKERTDRKLGRVILKNVSCLYLEHKEN